MLKNLFDFTVYTVKPTVYTVGINIQTLGCKFAVQKFK